MEQQSISPKLLMEQQSVQKSRDNKRTLDEYNDYIFPGSHYKIPETNEVQEFIAAKINKDIRDIPGLLRSLHEQLNRKINWVDMGGGHALSQRMILADKENRPLVNCTSIDLFDNHPNPLTKEDLAYLNEKYPHLLDQPNDPYFIKANIENVKLPSPADVITSVETMQYLDNPLLAITNWYNQLSSIGLMIIATEHTWSDWIRSEGTVIKGENHPLIPFFQQLEDHKISFSFSQTSYPPDRPRPTNTEKGFCTLVIQRNPNTQLKLLSQVKETWTNPHHYKAIYYEKHPKVIEVISV